MLQGLQLQADCPNRKTLVVREVEEIQALKEESSEEKFVDESHTLVTPGVSDLLVIQTTLHSKEDSLELG